MRSEPAGWARKRIGLVTPYRSDVQARIVGNYTQAGFARVGERHAGLQDNFSFCAVRLHDIETMTVAVAAEKPDATAVVCTNMDATRLAPHMEDRLGIPVIGSIAATLWGALDRLGQPKGGLAEFGCIFAT